jgi:glycerophosphoryl diester phosphodiesterase
MEAFRLAIEEHRVDMTEFDVHFSKDGIPVIIHDAAVDRTTNGKGRVAELTLKELRVLDAGQGFKIPTLEELLKSFPTHPLAVEIKPGSEALTHCVIEMLRKFHNPDLCIVGSKHHEVSKTMRIHYPKIRRFCSQQDVFKLMAESKIKLVKSGEDPAATASIPTSCKGFPFNTSDWIDFLHQKKTRVFFWTINDADSARHLSRIGADGIITNDAPLVQKALM